MSKIIFLIVVFLVLGGVFLYKHQQSSPYPDFYTSPNPNFGYEDCVKSEGSILTDGYPKKCQTSDLVSYLEENNDPIDISKWQRIRSDLGFSILCPPEWRCQDSGNYMNIYNPNMGIITFGITVVTTENFQQSEIRHPNYKTPLEWYQDLNSIGTQAKAVEVLPEAIKSVPGTDGFLYPAYQGYDLTKLVSYHTGILVPGSDIGTNILLPFDQNRLVLVAIAPDPLAEESIVKEIIQSISIEH